MATLINVCGATRSGTTVLDLMLGNASDAFSCGEVYARFRPQRKHHFSARCRCGQAPCPIWETIGNVPGNQFHATVFKELGVKFVVDSSKELCWLIDSQKWAVVNRIMVFKLLLWKNPVELAYSHWKRGRNLNGWCHEFISYYSKFFATGLPFRSVHYNGLVGSPQRKLREICEIVGMPYFDGKERFWEKRHHHLFGSHGVAKQVADRDSTIRASEVFPPEFESQIDTLSQRINKHPEVQQILEILKQAEVSSRGGFEAEEQNFLVREPYPSWYYARQIRNVVRRFFPGRRSWVR
jgi:hypothetical protein